MDKFDQLCEITRKTLNDESGCEWVKSKSIQDIGTYTLEEVYELLDAIENKNPTDVQDELADLIFHLILYAELAEKQGNFTLENILETAIEKQRHRRLSLKKSNASAEEAHAYWKSQKKKTQRKTQSILDNIPKNMSALVRSKKIQDRAGDIGFDWDNVDEIIKKLNEEVDEFKVEYENRDHTAMMDELGDMLFTIVNIGRHLNIDAEQALRHANEKFMGRFLHMEQLLEKEGLNFESMSFKALLEVWDHVKK